MRVVKIIQQKSQDLLLKFWFLGCFVGNKERADVYLHAMYFYEHVCRLAVECEYVAVEWQLNILTEPHHLPTTF